MNKPIGNLGLTPSQMVGGWSNVLRLLEKSGLSCDDQRIVINDPAARKRLVRYWGHGCHEPTTSQKRACEIMGQNFLGIEEVMEHFVAKLSKKKQSALAEIPYPESVLEALKDTHILVASHPLNILEIRSRVPQGTFSNYGNAWYNDHKFAQKKSRLAWLFIRKDAVPGSISKNYDEQCALLSKEEEVPRAVEVVYLMTLYLRARGEKLFSRVWVRTDSLSSRGLRVSVVFGDGRLFINDWHDDGRYVSLGLASSQKF